MLVPEVHVESETEIPSGWRFAVTVRAGGEAHGRTITLSWADYEHWSHGLARPEHVARAVVEFLLGRRPIEEVPDRFDAATVRRWFPEIDREICV